ATRVRRFTALLDQAGRDDDDRALRRAGRLMLASHWSYGLRASLGHRETDRLVRMARAIGPTGGCYGAKITGGGGGGTVALLIRDEPAVFAAIENLRHEYTRQTGRDTVLFAQSGPGAAQAGVARVNVATGEQT